MNNLGGIKKATRDSYRLQSGLRHTALKSVTMFAGSILILKKSTKNSKKYTADDRRHIQRSHEEFAQQKTGARTAISTVTLDNLYIHV